MAVFETQIIPKLISRKIWVAEIFFFHAWTEIHFLTLTSHFEKFWEIVPVLQDLLKLEPITFTAAGGHPPTVNSDIDFQLHNHLGRSFLMLKPPLPLV